MAEKTEVIAKTNFQDQYDITLVEIEKTGELRLLLQRDKSNYPKSFTHIVVRLDFYEETGEIFSSHNGGGKCQICNHRTEMSSIVDFAIYRDKKIPAMKHLGVCESCSEAIEQAVEYTLDEYTEEIISNYI